MGISLLAPYTWQLLGAQPYLQVRKYILKSYTFDYHCSNKIQTTFLDTRCSVFFLLIYRQ